MKNRNSPLAVAMWKRYKNQTSTHKNDGEKRVLSEKDKIEEELKTYEDDDET